jgi:peptidyl-tRNA hydrolase, PTH2 family
MRCGKMCSQAAHASLKLTLAHIHDKRVKEWLDSAFTKITVRVESEEELEDIYHKAVISGLLVSRIIDSGFTEFNGVPTFTCIAIGPDTAENLQAVTGDLKLL